MNVKRTMATAMSAALAAILVSAGLSRNSGVRPFAAAAETPASADLQAFARLEPIDAHAHVFKSDLAFVAFMARTHLHILDILVVDDKDPYGKGLQPQLDDALTVVQGSEGHAVLCTTFDPYQFEQTGFAAQAVRQINQNFAQGAVAVKIWKNLGMELKDHEGKFVMPDAPAFEPIYQDIAEHQRTLIAHLAEPDSCWLPPQAAGPDYSYYQEHPEWYMYNRPGYPSKQAILAARDHILAKNPKLRVVGAHLGSMETDVNQIAGRFDRYPNFAVDTAARIGYLARQPRAKVRAFLIKYQDRVLYGTDLEFFKNGDTGAAIREWSETYAQDWKFFATDETFEYEHHKTQGLKLPEPVLRKLFHENAARWIPGVVPSK